MAALEMQRPARNNSATFKQSMKDHWNDTIKVDLFAECQLLILTFCVGIQDACSFPDYHCFASNQTGNTVLLAIAMMEIGKGELFQVENIGVSLACFLAGAFIAGQIGNLQRVGQRKRSWLVISNLAQTLMVLGASTIQYSQQPPIAQKGPKALGVLALLSFASGAQVTISRAYVCTEISTAMATAAWVDLMLDGRLWQRNNKGRNRRLAFLVTIFAGAAVGGCLWRWTGSACALLVSAALKAVVTMMIWYSKREEPVSAT